MTMLNNSTSGLLAFQRALATTSHNISNVNTEGYSRQRVELSTRPASDQGNGFVGNGVQTGTVQRIFDQNLEDAVRRAGTEFQSFDKLANFNGRVDNLLADKDAGLSPALQGFFDSLEDVANDPSSSSARQMVISESENLVSRFDLLDRQLRSLDDEVTDQMQNNVSQINQHAESIANLNREIRDAEGRSGGQPANDLRDQRDQQLQELSDLVGTQTIHTDDGGIDVMVGNGQPLVVGNDANSLDTQRNEFDPSREELVFVGADGSPKNVTNVISGGELGGLMEFRENTLDSVRNDLGQLATDLSNAINAQHNQGIQLNGEQGGDVFSVAEPRVLPSTRNSDAIDGAPDVAFVEDSVGQLTGSDYRVTFEGGDWEVENRESGETFSVNDDGDGEVLEVEGLRIDVSEIEDAEDGDRFEIQPTRDSITAMETNLRTADEVAAAFPVVGGEATGAGGTAGVNRGDGEIGDFNMTSDDNVPFDDEVTLTFDADANQFTVESENEGVIGTLDYDPAVDSNGKTFSGDDLGADNPLTGIEFTMAGTPRTDDAFVIESNEDGSGDNRNAQALAEIANEGLLNDGNDSPQDFFSRIVGEVGTETQRSQSARDAQESLLRQAEADRESVSGVNLEEEAADLLRFQQGFQAAAQAASVADNLFQTVINTVGR
ncbi:flagellar hook-associated protein FlgK [Aquisalimonas asiatica]|uniref:Flagellar hook-associated protein 1 n=1 Tax=Aquisalimonas asiatica TaxID=406100 RepID=A0A1H8UJY8_9GAMM|nr:flagellar hook-associated protein FlgK [Aquisalimonas asiatica]SEP03491.1 flagellar hook-associated protein 1 FlgK [Aquisalimonas asiatica]